MSTPLPTLSSAAGNLTLDAPRPARRASAPHADFSCTLSRERRIASDAPPSKAGCGRRPDRPARPPEPEDPQAPDDVAAGADAPDAAATSAERPTAQSTDADAQGMRDQPAPAAAAAAAPANEIQKDPSGQESPPPGADEAAAAVAALQPAAVAPETGLPDPAESTGANLQQPPAPAAPPTQSAATLQAPAGPGLHFDAPLQTGESPGAIPAPPPDTPANPGGEQAGAEARSDPGSQDDATTRDPKAGAGLETGKGLIGSAEHQGSGDPALGRAVQVQAAVQVENMTGHAPNAPAVTPKAATAAASLEGRAGAPPEDALRTQAQQFANHVVRGLSAMIGQRGGAMNMRLHPPELGQLRVQMTIARGVVTAQFQPATAEAQALLDRSLATLRTALEGHGLSVERLTVHTAPAQHAGAHARDGGEEQTPQQRHHADAGHGQSRGRHDGRHDGRGAWASHRFRFQGDHEFEMPQPAAASAGDEP